MNDQTNMATNGSGKKVSKLQRLLTAREGKKLTKDEMKSAADKFKAARAARDKAEKAFAAAKAAEQETCEAMIMAYGNAKITIGSDVFEPTCRGESVFYQKITQTDNVSI